MMRSVDIDDVEVIKRQGGQDRVRAALQFRDSAALSRALDIVVETRAEGQ